MPSFRTLLALAATAFAAFSSTAAVPLGPSGLTNGVPAGLPSVPVLPGATGNGLPTVPGGSVPGLSGVTGGNVPGLSGVTGGTPVKRQDDPLSYVGILVSVQAQLMTVSNDLKAIISGKTEVQVDLLLPILDRVTDILHTAVAQIQIIIGRSTSFILTLDGKVWAIADVAQLLVSVLTLIGLILSAVVGVAGAAQAHIISGVGLVLYDFICISFTLVVGLQAAVAPLVGPLIQVFVGLQLSTCVDALQGNF